MGKVKGVSFKNLSKKFAGKALVSDFEEIGNRILAPYGLEVLFGDHEVMVAVGKEEYDDGREFYAFACAMWMDEEALMIDNVHVEFSSRYPEENYSCARYNLTDSEYERGVRIMDEFLSAATE